MTAALTQRPSRLLTAIAAGLLTTAGLTGCVGIDVPAPSDQPGPGEQPGGQPADPAVSAPTWYGDNFDSDGCPVPNENATLERYRDVERLLGVSAAPGWCAYRGTSYTSYYLIPAVSDDNFSTAVRDRLQPEGWVFESADDDSPQWSWLTEYPESAVELGFSDGAIDGAIFDRAALTVDDTSTYRIWFVPLFESFDEWRAGDPAHIVGFW